MMRLLSLNHRCRNQACAVSTPRASRRFACQARSPGSAQLTKTLIRPADIISSEDTSPRLLIGPDALKRRCLQAVLGRHGLTVEDATPVEICGLDVAADLTSSLSSAQNQEMRPGGHREVDAIATTGLKVPPPKGRRLVLAREVKPATYQYNVRITGQGAVSGAITQRPQCDVAPDMFWEGRTCTVLMTGPDALEPPGTAYYQQTVLPRKILFLRLVAVAHTARAALMPWEGAAGGPELFVSGYVTPGHAIIICDADPECGGPAIRSGAVPDRPPL